MMEPRYIGDGVYVSFDGYHVWLLTGSHDNPKDKVALELEVYLSLKKYADKAFEIKETT